MRSEMLVENEWNSLRRDEVRLPDGFVLRDFYVSVRPHLAVVFPLTMDGNVVFVRQYKHGAGAITTELPSGTFWTGAPRANAARELREETGYAAKRLVRLGTLYTDSTKNTSRLYAFLGLESVPRGSQQLDYVEARSGLEVLMKPLAEIEKLVRGGVIKEQTSVVTCLLALSELGHR